MKLISRKRSNSIAKRLLAASFTAVLFFIAMPAARADMVWSNTFYSENADKLVTLEHTGFIVNSKSGGLTPKEAPGSKVDFSSFGTATIIELKNGDQLYLNRVYKHRGKYWGIRVSSGHGGPSGWFPMDQLLERYDRIYFNDDHQNEFYDYGGDFDIGSIGGSLVMWQWPGSDYPKAKYNIGMDESDDYYDGLEIQELSFYFAYTDSENREWAFVRIEGLSHSTAPGWRWNNTFSADTWICLSDPENSDIPAFNPAPEPREWAIDGSDGASGSALPRFIAAALDSPAIIAAAVALILGVAALVLLLVKRISR